jgi:hypothetical protein
MTIIMHSSIILLDNSELEKIWKQEVMTRFEHVLAHYVPEGAYVMICC